MDTAVVESLKALDPTRPIREEKHKPASGIDTAVVESLKALDPTRPIREADVEGPLPTIRFENVGWPVLILGAQ